MFKPLKNLFKYIQNFYVKSSNDKQSNKNNNTSAKTAKPSTATISICPSSSLSGVISKDIVNMESIQMNPITSNTYNIDKRLQQNMLNVVNNNETLGNAQYNVYDEDDIETQIKSSIMLRKPLRTEFNTKVAAAISSSSSTTSTSPPINTYNDNQENSSYKVMSSPYNYDNNIDNVIYVEDDELEDFHCNSMEKLNNEDHENAIVQVIPFDSIDEIEEEIIEEEKLAMCIEYVTNDALEDNTQFANINTIHHNDVINLIDSDESCLNTVKVHKKEDEEIEETFITLNTSTDDEIIVQEELSSSSPLETGTNMNMNNQNNIEENIPTSVIVINEDKDNVDPLAIAEEDQEAFSIDRAAVLKELNLLNPLGDENEGEYAATDNEMVSWLENDENENRLPLKDPLPTQIADNNTAGHEEKMPKTSCVDERGDGSDSGLGSETPALQTTMENNNDTSQLMKSLNNSSTVSAGQNEENSTSISTGSKQTRSTNNSRNKDQVKPKDKNKDIMLPPVPLTPSLIPEPAKQMITTVKRSNLKRPIEMNNDQDNINLDSSNVIVSKTDTVATAFRQKKQKRSIGFHSVHVYYFPRQQGFNCVPSTGGCTLGMAANHESFKIMTLAEHTAELRRAHRLHLQEINPRNSTWDSDSEESEEDFLSECSSSDLDGESNGFLQPVSPKQRRAILKAAGIRKIDPSERVECRDIRNSREICGCNCRNYCSPETCSCSKSGIKCQVDRDMFPCGCTRETCGNTYGRIEFNSDRVHTHYIHTLLRLEMESRQDNPYQMHHISNAMGSSTESSLVSATSSTSPLALPVHSSSSSCSYYQNHMPTQSNYSSGYASPAYNIASESNQPPLAGLNAEYYHHTVRQQQQPDSIHLFDSHLSANDAIMSPIINQYNVDGLDETLYSTAAAITTTASIVASSCSFAADNLSGPATCSVTPPDIATPFHTIDFDNIPPEQVSPVTFNGYHNDVNTSTSFTDETDVSVIAGTSPLSKYSSCAVPSDPPFGTATTTESSIIEFSASNQLVNALETTSALSCVTLSTADITNNMETDVSGNFLNTLHVNEPNIILHNVKNNNQMNGMLQNATSPSSPPSALPPPPAPQTTTTETVIAHMSLSVMATSQEELHTKTLDETSIETTMTATYNLRCHNNHNSHEDTENAKTHNDLLNHTVEATILKDDLLDSRTTTETKLTESVIMNTVINS